MLTPVQKQLLDYIHNFIVATGYSPSFIEMQRGIGIHSKSGIFRLLAALEERGFIRRLKNRKRAIEVLKPPSPYGLDCYNDQVLLEECAKRGLITFTRS